MNKDFLHRFKHIGIELAHHLPYSIFGVIASIIIMGFLTFLVQAIGTEEKLPAASAELFHVFHPAHILFSAVATTAVFWKHDNRNMLKAIIVGFVGSVAVCGVSDIFMPYIGGSILGYQMQSHICLIETPGLILSFAFIGVFAGFMVTNTFEKSTEYSHGMHVFLSSMASLLYLMAYGLSDWTHAFAGVFLVTVVSVVFPCCFSDIVFPMLCTHRYCKHKHHEVGSH